MKVRVRDEVLLKAYPKGKKFEPLHGELVHQVLRRHKDDLSYSIGDPNHSSNL